jgi:hypothetical protein
MNRTRFGFFLACFLFCTSLVPAEDVTIYQVFQHEKQSHFPSPPGEVEFHKRKGLQDKYINRGPIFVGETEDGDDRTRLYRWYHPKSDLHFVGFEVPPGVTGLRVDTFEVYVWRKEKEGLVPVYCSVAPNGTDAYLTTDLKEHKKKIVDDWKSKKIRRRNLKVVFYAKPVPEKAATP